MKKRFAIMGLAALASLLFITYLTNAGNSNDGLSPHATERTSLAYETEPVSGAQVQGAHFEKALSCTLAAFHFDGGEQEWTRPPSPPSAFEKSDYYSYSPDSSWRARDHDPGAADCYLESPWIYIWDWACEDSIRNVEVEFRVNEYVPGAMAGGFLKDYYALEVLTKSTTTGWPGEDIHFGGTWYEMFRDYDREYYCICPGGSCDCLENWRLEDKHRIYNGYATLDPAIGDSIRLRFHWKTDTIIQATWVWCDLNGARRGTYFDDVVISGGPGVSQDVAEIWEDEGTRPIVMGVMVDTGYWLKSTVRNVGFNTTAASAENEFTLMSIDTTYEPDETTYTYLGSCQIPAGLAPGATAQCSISWTPQAFQMGSLAEQLIITTNMAGDLNSENDTLKPLNGSYYVEITPPDTLMLGYDAWTCFYPALSPPGKGYAVRFEPHTVDPFQLYGVSFLAAYGGSCCVHVFSEGPDDGTPGSELAVTDTFVSLPHDSGWIEVDLSSYSSLQSLPGNSDFWVWIEELDSCGLCCDESTIDGEHSYIGSPLVSFVKHTPPVTWLKLSPMDFLIRAWLCSEGLDCGDCNGDGNVTFADALALKNYYYQTPPGSPPCQGQGDVNLDGNVTFGDALYIKNYYYQTPPGSPPPCEPPKTAPFREKRMER